MCLGDEELNRDIETEVSYFISTSNWWSILFRFFNNAYKCLYHRPAQPNKRVTKNNEQEGLVRPIFGGGRSEEDSDDEDSESDREEERPRKRARQSGGSDPTSVSPYHHR